MKSDNSRNTFDPRKHFSSVRMQQGRVQVDADSNEQIDIVNHRIEVEGIDVIGVCGAPMHYPAFHIVADLLPGPDPKISHLSDEELSLPENKTPPANFKVPDFLISAGRYYVDGILCENDRLTSYLNQPDLPGATALTDAGWYVVYVDVWRRLLTPLDDPSIREVALGGPDTATREKTIWQVKYWSAGANPINCGTDLAGFNQLIAPPDGQMSAQTKQAQIPANPCIVPPGAGYTGLENQFYRIEIHDGGDAFDVTTGGAGTLATRVTNHNDQISVTGNWQKGQAIEIFSNKSGDDPMNGTLAYITENPVVDGGKKILTLSIDVSQIVLDELRVRPIKSTFKWSRDNGSIVTSILNITGKDVTVHDLGRDDVLGFKPGQWVEIIDDQLELNGLPGQLAQITFIDNAINKITLNATPALAVNQNLHPKLRRWDGLGAVKFHPNNAQDHFLDIESGIQIRFFKGAFRSGDYWNFPARTATADTQSGNIEWPRQGNSAVPQSPFGIKHHYCRLAILHWDGAKFDVIQECRNLFPPITELTSMFYLSGENQEVMPDLLLPPSTFLPLERPLTVGVANGKIPVANAEVRFEVTVGNGQIQPVGPAGTFNQVTSKILYVLTDQNGLAQCNWLVDSATQTQQVKATLQAVTDLSDTVAKNVHLPVTFTANLSVASKVAYKPPCPPFNADKTVQSALERLTSLMSLYEVSGNNQVVMPGETLKDLVVRAANRCGPVAGQQVRFEVVSGGGTVNGGATAIVNTDGQGNASCSWKPDPQNANDKPQPDDLYQEVRAVLLPETSPPTTQPTTVRFTCTLITAKRVFYDPAKCPALATDKVSNVQDAIDHLCEAHGGGCDITVGKGGQFERLDEALSQLLDKNQTDICICLLAGDHQLPSIIVKGTAKERVKIVGCGRGTRLTFPPTPVLTRFSVTAFTSFILRDVEVLGANLRIEVNDCDTVAIENCYMTQTNQSTPFINIARAESIRFMGNTVDARTAGPSGPTPGRFFANLPELAALFNAPEAEFPSRAAATAARLAGQPPQALQATVTQMRSLTSSAGLAPRKVRALQGLTRNLSGASINPASIQASLEDIRAAFQVVPGVALVIADAEADTWIADNEISGVVSFYGDPGPGKLTVDNMKNIALALRQGRVTFAPSQSQLHFGKNKVYRIDVSAPLKDKLRNIVAGAGGAVPIESVYLRSFITDNKFSGSDNNFIMEHLSLNSNSFEKEAGDAGNAILRAGIYVGNFSTDDIRLFNASLANQKIANLTINIVDS